MGHNPADRHREVEAKYDVDEGYVLPDLADLVPGGQVTTETVRVESTYFDTADRALLGTRLTLRRRTGDIDTGWQLKVPDGDARVELRWPLGTGRGVPADVREVSLGVRGRAALAPVATLSVQRHLHRLIDADGVCLAEVVDDTVTATRPGDAAATSTWRELEVELVDGDEDDLRAAGKRLTRAGARPSASASKLARALGSAPTARPAKGTLARVVATYLDRQYEAIVRGDLDLRRAELPVHATRTAIRRYRSVLRVLEPVLDADRAVALDEALQQFALVLGEIRDVEVLRDVLATRVEELPEGIDRVAVHERVTAALDVDHERAVAALGRHLRTKRHLDLLAELRSWHATPPIDASRQAADALRFLARADSVARKRLAQVPDEHHADDERMHRARKAAKRARYVAELAAGPGVGRRTHVRKVGKRHKKVQQRLGDRQDAVVAAGFLLGLAAEPGPAGFGLGVLFRQCLVDAEV